jgi:hypothetical protein
MHAVGSQPEYDNRMFASNFNSSQIQYVTTVYI